MLLAAYSICCYSSHSCSCAQLLCTCALAGYSCSPLRPRARVCGVLADYSCLPQFYCDLTFNLMATIATIWMVGRILIFRIAMRRGHGTNAYP